MRNDARPIGEDADKAHLGPIPHQRDQNDAPADSRDSVTHDRQSHIVNREAEENAQRKDADVDPVMPTGDSTIRTRV